MHEIARVTDPEIVRDIGIATLKGEVSSKPALELAGIFKVQLTKGTPA
ncbi:hypothetical protein [Maritimibacter sp. 55A14]|nr:hypothetical protein [Maritimibacter sp. 55A14]